MPSISVGLREFKTHLSEYLRQVKSGQTITITERGKVIGRLIPASLTLAERTEAMRQAGLAEWNGRHLPAAKPLAKVRGKRTVAELLLEARR